MKYAKRPYVFYVSDAQEVVSSVGREANTVARIINSNNYRVIANTVRNAASTLSSFLGGVNVLVNLVFTFLPEGQNIDQVLLEELREGFREVNSRLDSLEEDVESLRDHIEWNSVRDSIHGYVHQMNVLSRKVNSLKQNIENNAPASYISNEKRRSS